MDAAIVDGDGVVREGNVRSILSLHRWKRYSGTISGCQIKNLALSEKAALRSTETKNLPWVLVG